MLLLLLMYTAPLLALALGARARAGRAPLLAAGVEALRTGIASEGRRPLLLVLAGAAATTVACAGVAAGVALVAGAAVALLPMLGQVRRDGPAWNWAILASSLGTGALGFLAWFYADPAGAVVLVCFVLGVSLATALAAVAEGLAGGGDAPVQAMALNLLAVAATLEIAAAAESDALLSLGGLMAEAETLRSELLLLPLAIQFLSLPVSILASRATRLASAAPGGAGEARAASILLLGAVVLLHASCSLSWNLVACFGAGLVLREAAGLVDRIAAVGGATAGRPSSPGIVSALLAVAGAAVAAHLGGEYGVAIAAIGATATFPVSLAAAWAAPATEGDETRGWSEVADATSAAGAALAAMAASGPALLAALARAGEVPGLVATAPLALLFSVVAGMAFASGLLERIPADLDAAEAPRAAALAVAGFAALPALAGLLSGPDALAGATVGVVGACLVAGGSRQGGRAIVGRPAWVACGGTAALSALVAAPMAV